MLSPLENARISDLHTELDRYAPTPFAAPFSGRFPSPETAPQILGNPFQVRPPIRSLAVHRKNPDRTTAPYVFELDRGWFEFEAFTFQGSTLPVTLSLNPGDRLFALCQIDWAVAQTTFQELVSTDPDVTIPRQFWYKTGAYRVRSALVLTVPAGATPPTGTTYFGTSTDPWPSILEETHAFQLGTVLNNGAWLPNIGSRGTVFLPAGLFDIASILQP
jgi:hypothetical protein